jgi:GTP cyclohydrolase I
MIQDIQSEKDVRDVIIEKVGVKNIKYPIIVGDRENGSQQTTAEIDIYVDLAAHHRGTHMSRFIEVLNHFHKETLIDNLPDFLYQIKEELQAERAYTTIKFPYFMKKTAPVSKMESLMSYQCRFEAYLKDDYKLKLQVVVPVTSLCPCSKEISQYGAHNQRSEVTVSVFYKDHIWLEELIEMVEETASCEIYSLLKRPDEKYVTEKAYENPKFVEDMVRDLTLKFRADERITSFTIESENFESIHNHNAYACVVEEKN